MKNPFKPSGFDCLISRGTVITGSLCLEPGAVTMLDGTMYGESITVAQAENVKQEESTTLLVTGGAGALKLIKVQNVTITGGLSCDVLHVEGQLSIKNGAKVTAREIFYRALVVEPKAIINGRMIQLDSEAETAKHRNQDEAVRIDSSSS